MPGRRLAIASTTCELGDGGHGPNRLLQQERRRLVGRGRVEAGLLDRRAEHRLAARARDDVDVLAANDPRRRQRPAEAERLAFHGANGQPACETSREPGAGGEHDAVGLDPRAVGKLDARRRDLDDVGVRAQVVELRREQRDDAPWVDLRVLVEQEAAHAVGEMPGSSARHESPSIHPSSSSRSSNASTSEPQRV